MKTLDPTQEPAHAGELTQLTDSDEYKLLRDMLSVRHYLRMRELECAQARADIQSSSLSRQAVAAACETSENGTAE